MKIPIIRLPAVQIAQETILENTGSDRHSFRIGDFFHSGASDISGALVPYNPEQGFRIINPFYDNTAGCSFFVLPGSLLQEDVSGTEYDVSYISFLYCNSSIKDFTSSSEAPAPNLFPSSQVPLPALSARFCPLLPMPLLLEVQNGMTVMPSKL